MEIVITIKDDKYLEKIGRKISLQALHYFLKSSQEELSGKVARETPVLTGNLQGSWVPHLEERELIVYNDAHYAGFVEDGTRFMSGRHMARKGAEAFKPSIPKLFWNAMLKTGG